MYVALNIYMVKDHSESERRNPMLPHGQLFPISSKGSFICIISWGGGGGSSKYFRFQYNHGIKITDFIIKLL